MIAALGGFLKRPEPADFYVLSETISGHLEACSLFDARLGVDDTNSLMYGSVLLVMEREALVKKTILTDHHLG